MAKYKNLKEFFETITKNVKYDKRLWEELLKFRLQFMTKNDDHSEFFGDKLFGVHVVRFSSLDDIELVENIYGLDLKYCQNEIYLVEGINKEYKVSSNFIYELLVYTMHKFITNPVMNKNEKTLEKYLMEPLLILEYKMFASLYTRRFRYPVTKELALAALQRLSNKYLIKQLNSWQDFFEYRIKDFITKKSIYYKSLIRYTTEDAINITITLQTKLRSVANNLSTIVYDNIDNKLTIKSEDMFFEDGNMKPMSAGLKPMIEKTKFLYRDRTDFVDEPLARFIEKFFNNLPADMLLGLVKALVSDESYIDKKKVESYIEDILVINYEYLNRINISPLDKTNIYLILTNIKNYWSSSKVKNSDMKRIKKSFYKLSMLSSGRKTSWMNVANSIALVVYIYAIALKNT